MWFTFLPSFGFILTGAPLIEASQGNLHFGAPLSDITAVVVIASLALFFAGSVRFFNSVFQPWAAVVVIAVLFAQLKPR